MKKKICKYCKKKYKKHAKEVTAFGSTFCLHDEKLDFFERMGNAPMRATPSMVTGERATSGSNKTEQDYIDRADRAGDVVVRGSDGSLRRMGAIKKKP